MFAPLLTSPHPIASLFAYAHQHIHRFGDAAALLQTLHTGITTHALIPTRLSRTYPADLYRLASLYLYVCADFITLQDSTTGIGVSLHPDRGYLFSCTKGTYTTLASHVLPVSGYASTAYTA